MIMPYFECGGITIYHGDYVELLPQLDFVADLLITDPPYGVSWASGHRKQMFDRIDGDDGNTAMAEFLRLPISKLRAFRHIYCFGASNFADLPIGGCIELIWDKQMIGLGNLQLPWGLSHEKIMFGVHSPSQSNRARGDGNLAARMRKKSVLRYDRLNSQGVKNHPTEKPVPILRDFIESSSMIGELIFDPYCGSGSTLVAATVESRQAVGIEIEEKYCEIAANRVIDVLPKWS